jgi:hypothetical protein
MRSGSGISTSSGNGISASAVVNVVGKGYPGFPAEVSVTARWAKSIGPDEGKHDLLARPFGAD